MSRFTFTILIGLLFSLLFSGCRAASMEGEPAGEIPDVTAGSNTIPTSVPDEGFSCGAVNEIPPAECRALVAFYEATGGSTWEDNSGWLESDSPSNWVGVTCVDGHVDTLVLFFNNLQGQLPAELADLTRLRVLDLHNNGIGGQIPPELGRLPGLETLDLSANRLSGAIPATIGDLAALQGLYLANNELSGTVPVELGQITTLRNLDLAHNQLEGAIPAALAELSALESLRLSDNRLQGLIPFGLGELAALSEVDLSFNQLSGTVPSALYQVPIHRLWGNRLDGTILAGADGQQSVSYLGATLTFNRSLADSAWPELAPALPAQPGPGLPWAPPEHIVLTLVAESRPQNHAPLGLYLPAEAQIQIYPTAGLNAEVQPVVAALQQLLSEEPDLVAYEAIAPEMPVVPAELPLLPPSNALQTLRARVQYLSFDGGRGVRYLTQLSQGPGPINNQELFYTFQGLTADGATYVAAFFPVVLRALPDTPQMSDEAFTAMVEDWPEYLARTSQLLKEQPSAAFSPDLAALDALINSLSVAGTMPVPKIEGVWPGDGESVLTEGAFRGGKQCPINEST